jgi:murein hydrolase activator
MKRLIYWWLTLALLSAPAAARDETRAERAERELAAVQEQIKALGARIVDDRGRKDRVLAELQALERDITDAQATLATLSQQQAAQAEQVAASQAARQEAVQRLGAQQNRLAQQLRAAYQMGPHGPLQVLLQQNDPTRVARMNRYVAALNRARAGQIEAIRRLADELAQAEQVLSIAEARLAELVARQQETVDALERTRHARAKVVETLVRRLDEADGTLQRLSRDEAELETLLRSLRDLLADIPRDAGQSAPFPSLRGKLPRPVTGRVLAAFGQAKKGTQIRWKGQWIAAPADTAVRAVADGRVAFVGWLNRYGLMVIVEHDAQHYTLYGYQSAADVQVGQWVRAGDRLGRAGDSGGQTQSGVYFEIRRGTTAVDPVSWFAR